MKILNADQIKEADKQTIALEPIKSIDLMERAALKCTEWLMRHFSPEHPFIVVCGKGNNGGDGLAVARMLFENKYKVTVSVIPYFNNGTEDFKQNLERAKTAGILYEELTESVINSLDKKITPGTIIIDALIGSGLNGPVKGETISIIEKINTLKNKVISIDIPSGLKAEDNAQINRKHVIQATHTLTFTSPRLSFMFWENANQVGEFHVLDIGINPRYISEVKCLNNYITETEAAALIRPRAKFSHKGSNGHSLLITGSRGKIGAAILSSRACLNAGAGLITVHAPNCGYHALQTAIPEAMVSIDEDPNFFSGIKDLGRFNAIGIGPGIGTKEQTQKALKSLLQEEKRPMVFDADALNILSENKTWLSFLPLGSILTPHPGEFSRLTEDIFGGYEASTLQKKFAAKYNVYFVLKGAHTSIATPGGEVYFNSTGNPAMATAGSGDALTGVITSLLGQRYPPKDAALLGVYVHSLAGDMAAEENGNYSITASDIIKFIPKAMGRLLSLHNSNPLPDN
jgi:NAD(P)H-hydrate epimerase